jgi:hypothetical protein
MNTPDAQMLLPKEEARQPVFIPANAGKFSIIAAVIGIIVNLSGDALFEEHSAIASWARMACGAVIVVGIAAAIWGLARAWKYPGKDTILLTGTGLVMNGILIAIGFVTLPVPSKFDMGPKNLLAKVNVGSISSNDNLSSIRPAVTQESASNYPTQTVDSEYGNGTYDAPGQDGYECTSGGGYQVMGRPVKDNHDSHKLGKGDVSQSNAGLLPRSGGNTKNKKHNDGRPY